MPSGAPPAASHGGNRLSSGYRRRFPSGENAQTASSRIEAVTILRPAEANRVARSGAPTRPSPMRKFVGKAMTPSVLDSTKNKRGPAQNLIQRHTLHPLKRKALP